MGAQGTVVMAAKCKSGKSCRFLGEFCLILGAAVLMTNEGWASVTLSVRGATPVVSVGDTFDVHLWGEANDAPAVAFSAVQAILQWDSDALRLDGVDQTGAVGLFASSFPVGDAFGLNEAALPRDGNGLWVGLAFPNTLDIVDRGTLLTTFQFTALEPTTAAVALLASAGSPPATTKVVGSVPNQDVLGSLGGPATVRIIPEPVTAQFFAAALAVFCLRKSRTRQ